MLANRLKQCRTAARLSISDLAKRCGVSTATISKLERKQVIDRISLDLMRKISAGLGLSISKVFPDAKEGEKQSEVVLHKRRARYAKPEDQW